MKIITLILICIMLCNCKSLSNNTIGAASNKIQSSSVKEKNKQSTTNQDVKLLKRDMHFYMIHDTVKNKIKSKTNEINKTL